MRVWQIIICVGFLLIGIGTGVYLYKHQIFTENQKSHLQFEIDAHERVTLLKNEFKDSFAVLTSLGNLYASSDHVTESEFITFTNPLIKDHPGIQAVEWAPKVLNSNREQFVKRKRKQYPNYTITKLSSSGALIPVEPRPFYYPVAYITPLKNNASSLGFDLYSSAKRRAAINKTIQKGTGQATAPIQLIQHGNNELGFLLFHPIKGSDNLLVAVFQFEGLIESILDKSNPAGLHVSLIDTTDNVHEIIHSHSSRTRKLEEGETSRYVLNVEYEIGGRKWLIRVKSGPNFETISQQPLINLLAAILITIILEFSLYTIFRNENKRIKEVQLKENFLSVMSHEIRTPLHAIIGYIYQLNSKSLGDLNETQQTFVDNCQHASELLMKIVNDTLYYTKKGSANIEFEFSEFNIESVVEKIITLIDPVLEKNSTLLNIDINTSETYVYGDPKRIEQAIFNVLVNAIRHSHKKEIRLSTEESDGMFILRISDSGSGISKEDLKHIFDPYYQGGDKRTHGQGGLGLGLAVAQIIIIAHSGRIEVESEIGVGTTITISLPRLEGTSQ